MGFHIYKLICQSENCSVHFSGMEKPAIKCFQWTVSAVNDLICALWYTYISTVPFFHAHFMLLQLSQTYSCTSGVAMTSTALTDKLVTAIFCFTKLCAFRIESVGLIPTHQGVLFLAFDTWSHRVSGVKNPCAQQDLLSGCTAKNRDNTVRWLF